MIFQLHTGYFCFIVNIDMFKDESHKNVTWEKFDIEEFMIYKKFIVPLDFSNYYH